MGAREAVTIVRAGPAEYERIYRAESARILRLCRWLLGDPAEAEDVHQDVFVKLYHAQQARFEAMRWEAWLTRVAINACRDRRRSRWWKRWRNAPEVLEDGAGAAPTPSPEDEAVGRDARERIWRAFEVLSARQREVFLLRHVEGWTTEEVARCLSLSTGSVKRHLFRAIAGLRAAIGDRP
jgi:RNA polymerase sigma-70 factor (ECF subfamily)